MNPNRYMAVLSKHEEFKRRWQHQKQASEKKKEKEVKVPAMKVPPNYVNRSENQTVVGGTDGRPKVTDEQRFQSDFLKTIANSFSNGKGGKGVALNNALGFMGDKGKLKAHFENPNGGKIKVEYELAKQMKPLAKRAADSAQPLPVTPKAAEPAFSPPKSNTPMQAKIEPAKTGIGAKTPGGIKWFKPKTAPAQNISSS